MGVLTLATKNKDGKFSEIFFSYPSDLDKVLAWINRNIASRNMYFCPQLLSKPKRIKANVEICTNIWADLDEVDPATLDVKPSITLKTSTGRWQGLWVLSSPVAPVVAEQAARKLAYATGADSSGWDLTQLLRVPLTYNIKYEDTIVELTEMFADPTYEIGYFLSLPEVPEYKGISDVEFPAKEISKLDPDQVLQKYRGRLLPSVISLYSHAPDKDWSSALWSLENMLLEAGLSPAETFVVAWASATNKYKRDGRTQEELWQEVCKAKRALELKTEDDDEGPIQIESLLTQDEWKIVNKMEPSFVEKYVEWASTRSDASVQYHEAGAFTILSSILAESIVLPTTWGTVIPNLWFMILGDTTLTRKTTAMDMAMDLLLTVYEDCILATDGSLEGILSAIALRSGRTSVFWRDEFSGMLDAMKRRDYHAGMVEFMTKLYDGKYQKRMLRKEVIEVKDPIFIMFCGGIKTRITELFDYDYIINGFIPRFIFVIAEPDPSKFKPVGPPTENLQVVSTELLEQLLKLRQLYDKKSFVMLGDQQVENQFHTKVELTEDAWERYNALEKQMVEAGTYSDNPELYTPAMDRLAKSTLKMAMLLAALREQPEEHITVEVQDLLRAIKFTDSWKDYTLYVIANAGKSLSEKTLDRAFTLIAGGKNARSHLMRSMHLTSREADLILDTLEQRGLIIRTKEGKLEKLFPAFGGSK